MDTWSIVCSWQEFTSHFLITTGKMIRQNKSILLTMTMMTTTMIDGDGDDDDVDGSVMDDGDDDNNDMI